MGYHMLRVNNPWLRQSQLVKFLRLRTSIALKYGLMIVDVPENL